MFTVLVSALLAVAPADTVLSAQRGDVLVVQNFSGALTVSAWDRDEVEVTGGPEGRRPWMEVVREGEGLILRGRRARGDGAQNIRVPEWMPIRLIGTSFDLRATGLRAPIRVETTEGDLRFSDVVADVHAVTVDGHVEMEDVRGRVSARALDQGVTLRRVRGEVGVETVDGDVLIEDVEAVRVRVNVVHGDITFSGRIQSSGDYSFITHSGDVTVYVPEEPNATVMVSTFHGEFESDFPIRTERFTGAQNLRFTLGDGSARLILEAFDGELALRRGTASTPR